MTTIQEAKDLSTLPLKELLGSLMIHELMMQQKSKDKSKRKKVIALKATPAEKEDDEDSGSGEGESDNELVLPTKKFRRFLKRRGPSKGKPFFKKNESREKEKVKKKENTKICYKCKKLGYFRTEFFLEKKELKRKKAFVATWDECGNSSEEEKIEEVANLCFAALKGEEEQ